MKEHKDYTFHVFRKVADTTPVGSISLGKVFNLVTGDRLAATTSAIAAASASGETDRANRLKRELPCIAVHGLFPEGRKGEKAAGHTGVLFIDIDDSSRPPRELVRQCGRLPYVLFAQVSAKQKGIHLFVRADVDLGTHHSLYPAVCANVAADLGETCDAACRDIARLKFLSHDPEAYFNPAATPIPVAVPAAAGVAACGAGRGPLEAYLGKVAFPGKGGRHDAMVSLAANLNRCGFDEAEAAEACVRRYAGGDFGRAEIERIFRDIYAKFAADHGASARRRDDGPEGVRDRAGNEKTSKNFQKLPPYFSKCAQTGENDPEVIDIHADESMRPTIREGVFCNLPALVCDILGKSENAVQRDVDVITLLTLLGTVMPSVQGRFAHAVQHTNLFFALIGEPASGKGRINRLHSVLRKYHEHVYDESRKEVEEYRRQLEEYEEAKAARRTRRARSAGQAKLMKPKEVKQRDLDICGNISKARLIQQLQANSGFCTCLFDTEIENVNTANGSDFGAYMSILNQAFHGEPIQNNTLARGAEKVKDALLSVVMSGTPSMFCRLVPSTENGSFSRFMVYRLSNEIPYIPADAEGGRWEEEAFYDEMADRVLRVARFLEQYPTRVSMTNTQLQRLNRHFSKEHVAHIIDNEAELNSCSNRMRVIIYRLCMILTALRKAEAGWTVRDIQIDDADFEFAMEAGKTLLKHSYLMAAAMPAKGQPEYRRKSNWSALFASLPDQFKRSEILSGERGFDVPSYVLDKVLSKAGKHELVVREGAGHYRKTEDGIAFSKSFE